ncbi:immunoglobulin heavy chain variable region [Listeria ivanovii FSL F6-596]|uniref:hypothetical protein n=1 Tax=Listeria seeligeri TaxID=1640 RepID=UPI0001EB91DA|nr:hypothetical protein [Listeria seeligeri]EFR97335.1 immunoglobulin heavy chain variable region [Listeria ivanovii FSL F6-596]
MRESITRNNKKSELNLYFIIVRLAIWRLIMNQFEIDNMFEDKVFVNFICSENIQWFLGCYYE